MHEQVTLLRKLLSHIFEHYVDIQDEGYISDEDIEEYPETFMPRLHIMLTGIQEPASLQQLDTPHNCMILVPVIVLYSCRTLVSFSTNINSTELHLQGVVPRSQYSDPMLEVAMLE